MSTPPTTFGQRAAEYVGYQLAIRPRLRRATWLWLGTQILGSWAVAAAPAAAASTVAGALNWTGVADSHGVPVGNYYLSVVSTTEAITKAGPGLSADPSSWTRWLANAVITGLTHQSVVEALQVEAGIYIFMITLALWLMRFAMSNTWLHWLATWFRPLFETLRTLLNDLSVFPICLTAGLAIGGYHILWHGRKGHGSSILLSTFAIGILGIVLTRDPLTDLYNENGLLNQGRNLGFSTAQAFANNGPVAAGGATSQLTHLTGLIADATVRMPLQLMNFGAPVDDIGTCSNAYTAAMLAPHDPGDLAGPAHAMASCGAPQALAFAQHLDGANLALGLFFITLGLFFTLFVCYVTYSYVMVCCAAFINALLAVIAVGPAMIHGTPRRRAARRITMFFKHAALVFAYTTYISITAVIVLKMAARGGYADQVGMTHPLARLVMIAIISAVAIGAFWWLKRQLGDHGRHEFTHLVTDIGRYSIEGYLRGRGQSRGRNQSSRDRKSTPDQTSSPGTPDQPLTGPPTNGRPPGGRPPSSGRRGTTPPKPPPQPTGPGAANPVGRTSQTTRATKAGARVTKAGARNAGATVAARAAAPEVVIPAEAAAHIAQRLHTDHNKHAARSSNRPQDNPAEHSTPTRPATGRISGRPANQSKPNPAQPPRSTPNNAHTNNDPPEPPVKGR